MANAAILVGLNMIDSVNFTRRQYAIMTGLAVIGNACVIKGCRDESGRLMALDTIGVGRYMVVVFSGRCIAIVTGSAIVGYALVIECRTSKRRRVVAHAAILCGRYMWRINLGIFSGS